ncbi:hypothetical protein MERGE_001158 [Pneumocystis wakefieldiae]|uniref:Uncharacterized protein n=1 Tax=Pneumocystis wakefieldiae TaxID=38082 RepID=A0A899G3R8_9ASCO|nr:hypothetical protein MERGE_001158 [Pneumocystis wakefieldiae]
MKSGANVVKEAAEDREDKRVRASANRESSAPERSFGKEEERGREMRFEERFVRTFEESSDAYITHTSELTGEKEEYEDCITVDEGFDLFLERNGLGKELKNGVKSAPEEETNKSMKNTGETEETEEIEETGVICASDVAEKAKSPMSTQTEVARVTHQVETSGSEENFLNIHEELDEKEVDNVSDRNKGLEGENCLMSDSNDEAVKATESETLIEKPILTEESLEGSAGETMPEEGASGDNQSSALSNISSASHVFTFKKPKLKSASINQKFLNKAPTPQAANAPKGSVTQMEKASTSVQTNMGKPRLATKISSPAPYSLGGHQESVSIKSLDGKSTKKTSGFASHNNAPVWGRNRSMPIREYTDEELSSMHGIHLVHRLSATSDDDKAGKWDEMDDDETDWSDTIEFADGTKFTLPHEDHTASSMPVESSAESEAIATSASHAKPTEPTESSAWTPSFMQTKTSETAETTGTTSEETSYKHISKEERFGEEHYDRSWNSQRPVVPQIYNVNTGKFDIVDDSTKNGRRAGRRASADSKAKIGQNISFLSRHRASTQLKKEETTETYEQKPYKPISIIGNESRKKSQTLSEDSNSSSRNLPQHSAPRTGLMSTTKPSLSQSTHPFDPTIEDIEAFQKAIMTEAKEKARIRREEEEMERRMQQERARKKAEELAKLTQKQKPPETVPSKENETSVDASVSSQQKSFTSQQCASKTVNKWFERKKDLFNSSDSHTKTTITQTYKSITKPDNPEMNIHESQSLKTNLDNASESTLEKKPSIISSEPLLHTEKDEKSTEANDQTPVDSKQDYSKPSQTSNQSNINDNLRIEGISVSEKDPDKESISLDTSTLDESKDSSSTPLLSSEEKKSVPSTKKSSNKSSPSHSRTSSRFFPTTEQTEAIQSDNVSKTEEADSSTCEYFEKQDILPSNESIDSTDHLIDTNCSDTKSQISSQNTEIPQTTSEQSLKCSSDTITVSNASTITPASPTVPATHPEPNSSNSARHSTRPSRSFDDVMEQLAIAGNFAQNNEKFTPHLSNSKTPEDYIDDGLSVTTISPLEFENYSKSAITVSLHSLNYSNESSHMKSLSNIDQEDAKPLVNLPTSPYIYTQHQSLKRTKYFEPSQHTIDLTLYEEEEIDTLRLYLPETTPKNIKIKPSSTFLCKRLEERKQMSIHNK